MRVSWNRSGGGGGGGESSVDHSRAPEVMLRVTALLDPSKWLKLLHSLLLLE